MCPGYDTKQSDGEVPVILDIWGIQSTQFSQTVLIQTIQFSISLVFCLHTVKCQNCSIANNSV